jgi:hypothetical protein
MSVYSRYKHICQNNSPISFHWFFTEPSFLGKLKFQITNQQITIQTKFSGLKIEDIPKQNMQQCAAKFAAPDFPI